MAPRTRYSGFGGLKDTSNQPLNAPREVEGVPILETSGVPINDTHGTAVNASKIVLGDFTQLLLGVRSQLRIEVQPIVDRHQLAIVCWLRGDVGVAQPKSFAQITGVTP